VKTFPGTFAYQPIADIQSRSVFAYEALVRGPMGAGAAEVLGSIAPEKLHSFDHHARLEALSLAGRLGLRTKISLNLLPGTVEEIPSTLDELADIASSLGIPHSALLVEITESEAINRPNAFGQFLSRYRSLGMSFAIDDFGAGYSGLNVLADFQPDLIKLDMHLVRNVDHAGPRQAIARAVLQVCDDLGVEVIAEGVETLGEYHWLRRVGVRLFQGYLLGRPAFQALQDPSFPEISAVPAVAASAATG